MSKTKDKVIDEQNEKNWKVVRTAPAKLKKLTEDYEAACNAWVAELLRMWELDACYGYWADGTGNNYIYGDCGMTLSMDEIIYCVTEGVSEEEYWDRHEYMLEALEYNLTVPSIRAWHTGFEDAAGQRPFRRTSEETFEKFRQMKRDLEDAIEAEKKGQKF